MTPTEQLVEDLEETLWALGQVGLYEFSWSLRGTRSSPTEDEINVLCQEAYGILTSRYALHLEWFDWPPREGRPADEGTPLDFDTHRDFDTTELSVPFLALVPDDEDALAAVLAKQFRPIEPVHERRWWKPTTWGRA